MQTRTIKNSEVNTGITPTNVDGKPFYLMSPATNPNMTIWPGEVSEFVIRFNREITEAEAAKVVQIAGYFWKTIVKGTEALNDWEMLDGNTIVVHQGIYNHFGVVSHSSDPQERLREFIEEFNTLLADGSREREDGTRLIPGFGDDNLVATVWIDEILAMVPADYKAPITATAKNDVEADPEIARLLGMDAADLTFRDAEIMLGVLAKLVEQKAAVTAENARLSETLNTIKSTLG